MENCVKKGERARDESLRERGLLTFCPLCHVRIEADDEATTGESGPRVHVVCPTVVWIIAGHIPPLGFAPMPYSTREAAQEAVANRLKRTTFTVTGEWRVSVTKAGFEHPAGYVTDISDSLNENLNGWATVEAYRVRDEGRY